MSHSALFKLLKPEPVRTTQVYMMFYVSARFPLSQYDWIKSLVLGYGLSNTKIFAFLKHFFFLQMISVKSPGSLSGRHIRLDFKLLEQHLMNNELHREHLLPLPKHLNLKLKFSIRHKHPTFSGVLLSAPTLYIQQGQNAKDFYFAFVMTALPMLILIYFQDK